MRVCVRMTQQEKERLIKEAVEDVLAMRPCEAMDKVEKLAAAGVSSKEIERVFESSRRKY
jgi:hypothetical protein